MAAREAVRGVGAYPDVDVTSQLQSLAAAPTRALRFEFNSVCDISQSLLVIAMLFGAAPPQNFVISVFTKPPNLAMIPPPLSDPRLSSRPSGTGFTKFAVRECNRLDMPASV